MILNLAIGGRSALGAYANTWYSQPVFVKKGWSVHTYTQLLNLIAWRKTLNFVGVGILGGVEYWSETLE